MSNPTVYETYRTHLGVLQEVWENTQRRSYEAYGDYVRELLGITEPERVWERIVEAYRHYIGKLLEEWGDGRQRLESTSSDYRRTLIETWLQARQDTANYEQAHASAYYDYTRVLLEASGESRQRWETAHYRYVGVSQETWSKALLHFHEASRAYLRELLEITEPERARERNVEAYRRYAGKLLEEWEAAQQGLHQTGHDYAQALLAASDEAQTRFAEAYRNYEKVLQGMQSHNDRTTPEADRSSDALPIAGYNDMSVEAIISLLHELTLEQLAFLLEYEQTHKNRVTLKRAIDNAIERLQENPPDS